MIYSDRVQKQKDRSEPRMRFFKAKTPEVHGIAVEVYPFNEIHTALVLGGMSLNTKEKIPDTVLSSKLWDYATFGRCKAGVLLFFEYALNKKLDEFIEAIVTQQGFQKLTKVQLTYEQSNGSNLRNLTEGLGLEYISSSIIKWPDLISHLLNEEGFYDIEFSNKSFTHSIGVIVDSTHVYIMDNNRGVAKLAKTDFDMWFNKQSLPKDIENRKLTYLHTQYSDYPILVTKYKPNTMGIDLSSVNPNTVR